MAMAPPDTNDPALLLVLQTLEAHAILLAALTTPAQRQVATLRAEISAVEKMLASASDGGTRAEWRDTLAGLRAALREIES